MLSIPRFVELIATSFVCLMKHFNLVVTKPEPLPIFRDSSNVDRPATAQ